ncbi:MAG: hypothetical protein KIT83_09960 [Bryobacterales bacterium]|nr:hypothetical protein [Bryobacterales bacterium]
MSVNRELDHWIVLPEDDAYRQLATGFLGGIPLTRVRQIQVMPPAGGWVKAVEQVEGQFLRTMRQYRTRHLLLLIDFDNSSSRLKDAVKRVPPEVAERVFILGSSREAEDLRREMRVEYEAIGRRAADCCQCDTLDFWNHDLLRHNLSEVERIQDGFRRTLFS